MGWRKIAAAALCVALAAGCGMKDGASPAGGGGGGGGGARALASAGPGAIYLSGGASDGPPMLRRFRDLAGGKAARLVVVPFAGGQALGEQYAAAFRAEGVADVAVVPQEKGEEARGLAAVGRADGIYLVGGRTSILVDRLPPYADAIRQAWRDGAAVGGHSAGAMAMAGPVIMDGEAADALAKGAAGLEMGEGVGVLPGAIVDTHFGERARFPRLWVAATAGDKLGIGVDPGTAAVWTADGRLTAHGAGAVTLIKPEAGGARVTVLGDGDAAKLDDWTP